MVWLRAVSLSTPPPKKNSLIDEPSKAYKSNINERKRKNNPTYSFKGYKLKHIK